VIPTFAIIPTRGRDTLDECIAAVADQVDTVIVVDTSTDGLDRYLAIRDRGDRNISRWWNRGFLRARRLAVQGLQEAQPGVWNVVVLNDDVIVPPGWVDTMTGALRTGTADLAYPGMQHKITGYAFVLRGESRILADESLVWWFGDDDIEFQARAAGGVVTVHAPVDHRYPDHDTQADPALLAQTELDAKTFETKWGRMP
jgi:glycosyltransferase involved in cell wall biosynthesis